MSSAYQPYHSPFSINAWRSALRSYPDHERISWLLEGLHHGVRVMYHGSRTISRPIITNHSSTHHHEQVIDESIAAEVKGGRVAGPFLSPPFTNFIASPLGLVPKKGTNKWRLIHDLSWPRSITNNHVSINGINADIHGFTTILSSFDDGTKLVVSAGRGCWMSKIDIKSAYRHIAIHKDDWHLLGFMWRDMYYHDMALPFGLASAVFIWEQYATAIEWIAQHHSILLRWLVHYVDDFLLVNNCESVALKALALFLSLLIWLHVPVAMNKLIIPCQRIEYLGIIIDSLTMTASLSPERLTSIRISLSQWLSRTKCTPHELLSLIGTLSFAAKVVRPGRIFLRRLINLHTATSNRTSIIINDNARMDIQWWHTHMSSWNGVALLYELQWSDSNDVLRLHVTSDASSNYGCGAIYGTHWFTYQWTDIDRQHAAQAGMKRESVPWMELRALSIAAATWGHNWCGKQILFHTDCEPIVAAVNQMSSRSTLVMDLIRTMAGVAAHHSFDYRLIHIAGHANTYADMLSRGQVQQFLASVNVINMNMDRNPTIPLQPLINW